MVGLLNPENAYSGVNLVLLLCFVILSAVIFICFSGFIKYSIVLNILKNAMGTQQIPPSIVINLLAALLALNSTWSLISPGLEKIKPYFLDEIIIEQSSIQRSIDNEQYENMTMYSLIMNISDYFPEVFEALEKKENELEKLITLPNSFEQESILNSLLSSIIFDLYKGFELGIKLYMIFVSVDFLVAVILSGVGMSMLSPTVISIPIKLAIFYFSDGWIILFDKLS